MAEAGEAIKNKAEEKTDPSKDAEEKIIDLSKDEEEKIDPSKDAEEKIDPLKDAEKKIDPLKDAEEKIDPPTDIEEIRRIRREEKQKAKEALKKKEAEERKIAALKQMRYLLSMCEQYSEVYRSTISQQKVLQKANPNTFIPTMDEVEGIKKEVKKSKSKSVQDFDITKYLTYLEGGELRPYQIEGVTWMYMLYSNASNGILADEMGLGKTIQIIALICVLLEQNIPGPFLIVAPLTTIPNWESEFKKFAPKIPVVVVCGNPETRTRRLKEMKRKYQVGNTTTYPVVLVSYQMPLMEFYGLNSMKWKYIIVDEGHRIKNHETQLAIKLRQFKSENRLLLTGTPLQNNIMELWALLNFLLPNFFSSMSTFTELFLLEDMTDKEKLIKEEESNSLVSKMHRVLEPFMLRRVKKDVLTDMVPKKEVFVYCPLSQLQKDLYMYVLNNDIESLRGLNKEENQIVLNSPRPKRKCSQKPARYTEEQIFTISDDSESADSGISSIDSYVKVLRRITMNNTLMMYRKIVSHPYLVEFPLDPSSELKELLINEELVTSSGKLMVLDKLLPELKKRGHKVLLFSQLAMGLDLIEEYLLMRKYNYRRLDGSHSLEDRAANIEDFNTDPTVFIFIITTRAGGLGLNLTAADTVIFFDRDFNPQADLQAQDRCHRIGQTKPVVIYTLVAKNTVDESVLQRGKMKRILEKVVIANGKFAQVNHQQNKLKLADVLEELRNALMESKEDAFEFSNKIDFEKLLDRSDLYEQMKTSQSEVSTPTPSTSRGKRIKKS